MNLITHFPFFFGFFRCCSCCCYFCLFAFYVACSRIFFHISFSPPVRSSSCFQPSTASRHVQCSLPDLNREPPCPVFPAGPALQRPRPSGRSVPCRTSTATMHLSSVFPAGPQPRPSAFSGPCQTSTATICAQCSLPDLNRKIEC